MRPKKSFLEVCVFLPRAVRAPQVRRAEPSSKVKFANLIQIRHRDEVEAPITDWLEEAYRLRRRSNDEAGAKEEGGSQEEAGRQKRP